MKSDFEKHVENAIEFLGNISLRTSLESFMKRLLKAALKMLPGFDRGSVILKIGNEWRYVAWVGYTEELADIRIDPDEFFIPRGEDPIVIDNIFQTTYSVKSREINEKLSKAGTPDVKKTIAVGISSDGGHIGAFFLDSTEDIEVNESMIRTAKAFGKLATVFVSMKIHQERERGYQKSIIMAMVRMMEMRDVYTVGHSERVAKLSAEIAKNLRLDVSDVDRIYWGSIVHDIGKMGIPEEILLKPGRLTEEEFEIIKKHPVLGEQAITGFSWIERLKFIVRHHHERWDGSGYPDGLKGEEIPFEARIVALADAFDAMTSERSYRKALTLEEALKEIVKNSGGQFDPDIARKAIEVFKRRGIKP